MVAHQVNGWKMSAPKARRTRTTPPERKPCSRLRTGRIFEPAKNGRGMEVKWTVASAVGPGWVKTLRGITTPGILKLVVALRAKNANGTASVNFCRRASWPAVTVALQ